MDDALFVRGFERFCNLLRDGKCFIEWHRAACDSIGERLTLDELHHERTRAVRFFETVDRSNIRMI